MVLIERTIPLPRLLNADLTLNRDIRPISVSVDLSITPLSYASMELPTGEELPARSYVEMFTPLGSAGVFRVRSPQTAYGQTSTTAELEHAIVEVGDYVVTTDYDDMMAASTAMQTIFGFYRGSKWQLGDVSALGSGQIALESKHNRVLETMLAIMEQRPDCMLTFDFSTTPWTVAVAQRGTTVEAEGRLSRNVTNAKVIYDDTELCTRVYYSIPSTDSSGQPSTTWTSLDADTISTYGIVERDVSTGSKYTASEALAVATEYLNKHKQPRISVQINAVELSRITGLAWDTFSIGKMFRLALPDYNTTIEQDITAISFPDVYGNPMDIRVSLAEEEDTAIKFLHDVDAKGGSGGGGGAKKKQEDTFKEYQTNFERDDYHIELNAQHLASAESILEQAGLSLNSQGVLIYADDNPNMVASKLNVQADRISLVVEGTGSNAHINPASIVAAINAQTGQSTVRISADKVALSGTVIVDLIEGEDIAVGSLSADTIASDTLNTGDITLAGYIAKGGSTFEVKSLKVNNTEVAKFLGTADVNFDRAAAQRQGVNSVYISPSDIIISDGPDYSLNGGSPYYDVEIEASTTSTLFPSLSDTATQSIRVSATEAYADGVLAGEAEFTATTVHVLGSPVSVTPIGTSHTVNPIGTSHTITPVGTYRSGYKRGTSHTDALTGYTTFNNGNAIQLFSYSDGSYHPEGRAVWRKNGTVSTLYESGGQYGLYEGGDPVTYYEKGTAVTYYEAGTAATYYTDGGSQTYYTKQTPST